MLRVNLRLGGSVTLMKLRFLITAAIAALSIGVFAQGKPPTTNGKGRSGFGQGGNMRRGGMSDELKKELKLTAAQEKKIEAIRAKYRAKMQAMFKGMKPPQQGQRPDKKQFEAMMKKFQPIREAQQKEIDAVLTPKQREIMKKWKAAHPMTFGGSRGPGKGGGH